MCRFIQYIVLYASFCAPYISIYNAYNAMNPNIVYSKYKKSSYLYQPDGNGGFIEHKEEGKISIKKLTILPCIPSVTYTYRF